MKIGSSIYVRYEVKHARKIIPVYTVQEWELVVLQALKWDVAAVTAADFVDVIISQLSVIDAGEQSRRRAKVRQHALTFIVLSALGSTSSTVVIVSTPVFIIAANFVV